MNMDAAPFISDGRTLVPVRYLADALRAQTAWNGATRTITISGSGTTISLTLGSTTLTVNGRTQTMDVAPVLRGGRTYLPARYVAKALGHTSKSC
jgi:N-acetylmuramoyl-L-alanine amidase